jgi:hypothetical protein
MILTINTYPVRIWANFGKEQTSTVYLPAHQTSLKMGKIVLRKLNNPSTEHNLSE